MFFTLVNTASLGRCSCVPTCKTQWWCSPGTLPSPLAPAPAKSRWSCFAFKLVPLACNILPRKGPGCNRESLTKVAVCCPPSCRPPIPRRKEGSFGWRAFSWNAALLSWKASIPWGQPRFTKLRNSLNGIVWKAGSICLCKKHNDGWASS